MNASNCLNFVTLLFFIVTFLPSAAIAQRMTPYPYTEQNKEPDWIKYLYQDQTDPELVIKSYNSYYETHSFQKNGHTQNYKKWLRSFARTDQRTPTENRQYLQQIQQNKSTNRNTSQWSSIGPYDWDHDAAGRSYAPGSAHVYTVEQSISNPDILYAGTATAGLWKSSDRGLSWQALTDQWLQSTVYAIEIDHTNPQIVYASLQNSIYKSTNGGITFSPTGDASFQNLNLDTRDIRMHPTNNSILLACTDGGLYRTTNAGGTWSQIVSGDFQEIEFHPTTPSVVYAVRTQGNGTQFFRSTNTGASFTQQSGGWPVPASGAEQLRTEISVSPANPNAVYAHCSGEANGGSGLYGVYVSTNQGSNWTFRCCGPQPAGPPSASNQNLMGWDDQGLDDGGQYYYDMAFAVSPTNADTILLAGVNLWVSGNGGTSFTCPAKWSHSYKPNYVHADIHDIHYYNHTREIWVACDGGIFYSNDNGVNFQRRNVGILGTDFWGYGQGWWYGDVMLGGAYHNGTMLREENVYINDWICTDGGDGTMGFVNHGIDRQVYSQYDIKTLRGNRTLAPQTRTFQNKPNNTYIIGASSDLLIDPRYYTHWISGSGSKLFKTEDNGYSFREVYDFGVDLGSMDQSWSDPNVMYVCTWPSWWATKEIYRTTDGGATWTNITPPSSQTNGNTWIPYDIAVDHSDPMTIYIARTSMYDSNVNGVSAYKSTNGGQTWTNISGSGLNGHSPTNIVHQRGTDGGIYIGTRRAVFYKNNNMSDWELFNTNLPAQTHSTRVEPYYRKEKIRNATNRSVWESPLYEPSEPQVQISANTSTIYCIQDTAYFVDHSILAESGATWSWDFHGGIADQTNIRNPKVLYPNPGFYDVSLTITDQNGSDTKTFLNFIRVKDECKVDTVPGRSLVLQDNASYVQTPSFQLTTNTFTVTAWVKPDGTQPEYSAIFMSDGTAAGLNFRANNVLAYHWPGGQWWWNSNLTVPANEWSYVAMVVTPSGITLYVNGIGATHNFSVPMASINQAKIGSYLGWESRNFKGEIDEVSVWNRALTRDEIRLNRHLTKKPLDENQMTAYYQFNGDINYAYESASGKHGLYFGNSQRRKSQAPIGKGKSAKANITNSGLQTISGADFQIEYLNPQPNGEIVVSHLLVEPDTLTLPGISLGHGYWIINNYGSNQNPGQIQRVNLQNIASISEEMGLWQNYHLGFRLENDGGVPWRSLQVTNYEAVAGQKGDLQANGISSINRAIQLKAHRPTSPLGSPDIILSSNNNNAQREAGESISFSLQSPNQGLGVPVLTQSDLEAHNAPTAGALAYHEELKSLVYYDGSQWKQIRTSPEENQSTNQNQPIKYVGIGHEGHPSAILSAIGGFFQFGQISETLFPQIKYYTAGMVFYHDTRQKLYFYDGTDWLSACTQSITINHQSSSPTHQEGIYVGLGQKDISMSLQIDSPHKLMQLPALNLEQVYDPSVGLLIFDVDRKKPMTFDGVKWSSVCLSNEP